MCIRLLYFLVFILIVVKSESVNLKYINNTDIDDPNYCLNKFCILKCCPDGYLLVNSSGSKTCTEKNKTTIMKKFKKEKPNIVNALKKKNKQINADILLVYDDTFFNQSTDVGKKQAILEDGSIIIYDYDIHMPKLQFCVDLLYHQVPSGKAYMKLVYSVLTTPKDPDAYMKQLFVAIGMLISCFFLLLVVLVYFLLPGVLEGFVGLLLVTYVMNFFICFLIRGVLHIALLMESIDMGCVFITPVMYYFVMAVFFWSNVLSYDLWKRTRHLNSRHSLHCRKKLTYEEKLQFFRYCLYACGTPAIITITVVLLNISQLKTSALKPIIFNCFNYDYTYLLYVNLPIAIMTVIDCILFILTAYYIWYVQGDVSENTRSKNSRNKFFLYLKLSAIMGVNWLLELFPGLPTIPYIILNLYAMFIGLAIFLILTWNKQIYSKFYKLITRKKDNKPNYFTSSVARNMTSTNGTVDDTCVEETLT